MPTNFTSRPADAPHRAESPELARSTSLSAFKCRSTRPRGDAALRDYDLRMHNIRIHLDLAENLPVTSADPHQLQQVF